MFENSPKPIWTSGISESGMQFIGSFTTFNPISGYFVAPYDKLLKSTVVVGENNVERPLILDWMAGRARAVIPGRTNKQIVGALDTINWILHVVIAGKTELTPTDELPIEHIHWPEVTANELYTPARVMKAHIPVFDIQGIPEFPNAKWEELFAVLTLATLGNIHRFLNADRELSASTVALAAEAMEALTVAEHPALFTPELNQSLQERIRLRNYENVVRRHAKLGKWKAEFAEWVIAVYEPSLAGKPLNRLEAARQFKAARIDPELKKRRIPELEGTRDIIRSLANSLKRNTRLFNP